LKLRFKTGTPKYKGGILPIQKPLLDVNTGACNTGKLSAILYNLVLLFVGNKKT
jgi:hypothetical protein